MLVFDPHPSAVYKYDYQAVVDAINTAADKDPLQFIELVREWCRKDLFFLMYFVLRVNLNHPWIIERIKEVEDLNDRTLDLWAREHWKSTIITYGLNIQEVLRNPEIRIGIFSHTRALAKAFLHRIKHTFESNQVLKATFSDILWQNPQYEAPRWSLDEGIIVRRQGIYQEATIEANGLVDSMPTGKHYDILHYDDVVTRDSVTTPEQLAKIDDCFRLSFNLGAVDHITGIKGKIRVIGTPYHFNDQYAKMEKDGGWTVRKHPCLDSLGKPVLLNEEALEVKRTDMGPYVFNCQMLLNPVAGKDQRFKEEWLKYWRELPKELALYLVCDPANEKKIRKTSSDYTVYFLWGLDSLGNKFWIDCVRDRLTLTERWKALKGMKEKWKRRFGGIQRIGYEQYGMTADIQHYEEMMAIEGYYFNIIELAGTKLTKDDRIIRLVPSFEQGKVYIPEEMLYTDKDGNTTDLVQEFVREEYLRFPFCKHNDLLDAASRIEDKDLGATSPYDDMDDEHETPMSYDIDRFFNRYGGQDEPVGDVWTGY